MKKSIYLKITIIIIICTFLMWIVIKLSSSEEYSSVTENEQLPVTEQVINKDVIQTSRTFFDVTSLYSFTSMIKYNSIISR